MEEIDTSQTNPQVITQMLLLAHHRLSPSCLMYLRTILKLMKSTPSLQWPC